MHLKPGVGLCRPAAGRCCDSWAQHSLRASPPAGLVPPLHALAALRAPPMPAVLCRGAPGPASSNCFLHFLQMQASAQANITSKIITDTLSTHDIKHH